MDSKILREYEKVKDLISQEDFEEKFENLKKEYEDNTFLDDVDVAKMVVGTFIDEDVEPVLEHNSSNNVIKKISDLKDGEDKITVCGRVFSKSDPKDSKTKKGKIFRISKVKIADDTADIVSTFWTENIKLLKKFEVGDIIEITETRVQNFNNILGLNLTPRSLVHKLEDKDYPNFPEYFENITAISDLIPDEEVNIIGRITRISPVRTFDSKGKEGKVASFDIQDESAKVSYTLWNQDVILIEKLELKEGETVKLLAASVRERDGEISLTHWNGSIIKGDFDVPEFKQDLTKIAEVKEEKDVSLLGIVSKIQDTIEFQRNDSSVGYVKSIEIADDTGKIRVTLWGDDTKLDINKGDIIKITGASTEFDEYTESGYRANTNWNTRIVINPDEDSSLIDVLKEYANQLVPIKISSVQEFEDDGEEVDVLGRLISLSEPREFQREDGTMGLVRSAELADETGVTRVSFWDDKAQNNLSIGSPLLIENARTRLGIYSVELNVGKTTRIIPKSDNELPDLPSLDELEEILYTTKKLSDLEEDEEKIRIIARIMDIQEPTTFQRQDGTPGIVRTLDFADETGFIRASLWDNQAEIYLDVGDSVKIQNPRINFRNDALELSIGSNSRIEKASIEDTKDLPTYEELEESLYVSKKIDELEDDDRNIKVTGNISQVFPNKILSTRCPHCNQGVELLDDEYTCDYCGEPFDEPKYLLMIPTRISDDSEEDISVTFFGKLAEELLGISTSEIVSTIKDSGDEGVYEGKIEDLIGYSISIIADVNFDDYNEEIRLNPKKIVSIEQ